jgi:DNA-binding NtrC family response regulator
MRILGKKQSPAVNPGIYTLPDQAQQQSGRAFMVESLSPLMGQVYKKIGTVLNSRVPVLFQGETGVGKECLARVVHSAGKQRSGPFVVIQCQAASEDQLVQELFGTRNGMLTADAHRGKLGEADGGTVFLKNVDALPSTLQLRLLRLLQEKAIAHPESHEFRPINLRIIAATRKNLDLEVTAGRFRQDLYFRLTVYQCGLPPLRERRADIPKFVNHFANGFVADIGREPLVFTARTLAQLEAHDWPGNIRELRRVILYSIYSTVQRNKEERTVEQIKWADSNGHDESPGDSTQSLTIKLQQEAREPISCQV